jgi:hypothetical protein
VLCRIFLLAVIFLKILNFQVHDDLDAASNVFENLEAVWSVH